MFRSTMFFLIVLMSIGLASASTVMAGFGGTDDFGYQVALSPDSRVLVIGAIEFNPVPPDGFMRIFDTVTGARLKSVPYHFDPYSVFAFAETHTPMLVIHENRYHLMETSTGNLIKTFNAPLGVVSGDGRRVFTGGEDIRIHDMESGNLIRTLDPVLQPIHRFVVSHNGKLLLGMNIATRTETRGSYPGPVMNLIFTSLRAALWDCETGAVLRSIEIPEEQNLPTALVMNFDGTRMVVGPCLLDQNMNVLERIGYGYDYSIMNHDGTFIGPGISVPIHGADDYMPSIWQYSNTVYGFNFSPDGSLAMAMQYDHPELPAVSIIGINRAGAAVKAQIRLPDEGARSGGRIKVAWSLDLESAGTAAFFELISTNDATTRSLGVAWSPFGAAVTSFTLPASTPPGAYVVRVHSDYEKSVYADSGEFVVQARLAASNWELYQ